MTGFCMYAGDRFSYVPTRVTDFRLFAGDRADRCGVHPGHDEPVPDALQHPLACQADGVGPLQSLETAGYPSQGTGTGTYGNYESKYEYTVPRYLIT